MKKIKKILPIIMILILVLGTNIGHTDVKAAGASVTIALSSSTVSIGGSVTATVTVSGSDVTAYDIYVTYNSAVLQYVSGSGAAQVNGGGGTIRLVGSPGGTSINFTAIANGTCYISTSGTEVYNVNYEQLAITHAGANVTVATETTTESPTTENDNKDDKDDEKTTEDDGRSANCNLKSLQVSPGTLDPAFSSSKTSYFVQLDEDATSIVVSATTEDEKATTSISGADELKKGENIVSITVTAENGAVKVYKIRVAVGDILENAEVTIDGALYTIVNEVTDLAVPELFSATTLKYKEWDVMAYESPNKKIIIVCLENEDFERAWFIYDEQTDSFYPYCEYSASYNRYIIISVPAGVPVPEGYIETELSIQKNKVTAYQMANPSDEDIYLIYAMNLEGSEGFYLYDTVEGTFMRYISDKVIETPTDVATVTDATPLDASGDEDEGFFTKDVLIYIICGLGALLIVFIILTIVFAAKKKSVGHELEQAEDMIGHLTDKDVKKENPSKKPVSAKETVLMPISGDEMGKNNKIDSDLEEIRTVYDELSIQSAKINDKIKQDYDANMDSAFADNQDAGDNNSSVNDDSQADAKVDAKEEPDVDDKLK